MERCCLIVWISMIYLTVGVLPQYRDKNISITDSNAVQALLARYLQRRLQSTSQISTPPPPSVIFNLAQQNQRSMSRQATQSNNIPPLQRLEQEDFDEREKNERRERRYEYDDYEDDLEGFEDSDKSRTRINLLAAENTELHWISILPRETCDTPGPSTKQIFGISEPTELRIPIFPPPASPNYDCCDSPAPLILTLEEAVQLEYLKVHGLPPPGEAKPVQKHYRYGWWRITDVDTFQELLEHLHSRGVREEELKRTT